MFWEGWDNDCHFDNFADIRCCWFGHVPVLQSSRHLKIGPVGAIFFNGLSDAKNRKFLRCVVFELGVPWTCEKGKNQKRKERERAKGRKKSEAKFQKKKKKKKNKSTRILLLTGKAAQKWWWCEKREEWWVGAEKCNDVIEWQGSICNFFYTNQWILMKLSHNLGDTSQMSKIHVKIGSHWYSGFQQRNMELGNG